MSLINPLGEYIAPFNPVSNITPFTYRDGLTNLAILEGLRCYVNETLVDFVNTNFGKLGDDFETQVNLLITQVETQLTAQNDAVAGQLNTQNTTVTTQITDLTNFVNTSVASIINSSVAIVDPMLSDIIDDTASESRLKLNSLYSRKAGVGDGVIFVSTNGSDGNDGLSIGAPKLTINAAVAALPAGGGVVDILAGTYTVTQPLPNRSAITYRGSNRGVTRLNVTVGSLLSPSVGDISAIAFEHLTIVAYDTHMFNFTGSGGMYQSKIADCNFASANPNASIFYLRGTGSFQEITIENSILDRGANSNVSTVDIIDSSGAANANLFQRVTMHSINTTSSPAIRMESSTDQSYIYDNQFINVVGEQNPGGLIHMYSARGTQIIGCQDWDASVPYVADVIKVDKSTTNALISYDTTVINSGRRGGSLTAGVYDFNGLNSRNTTLISTGNSTNAPVVNNGGVTIDYGGLKLGKDTAFTMASTGVAKITPVYASTDALLLQDGIAGYSGKLLAFRAFTSTQNRATISSAGIIEWGSGLAPTDTSLSRVGVGVLQAGQKLTAVAGIGVGNSVAATTPGAVIKKIQIFDAAGASLGFIPVYDTIS